MCKGCWPPRLRRTLADMVHQLAVTLRLDNGQGRLDRTAHGCEWSLHVGYLGAAALHWDYAAVAAVLALVMVINHFLFPE